MLNRTRNAAAAAALALVALIASPAFAETLDRFAPCPGWMTDAIGDQPGVNSFDCVYREINLARSGFSGFGEISGSFSVNAATPQRVFIFDGQRLIWDSGDVRQPGRNVRTIQISPLPTTTSDTLFIVPMEGGGGVYHVHSRELTSLTFGGGGLIQVQILLDDGNIGGPGDTVDFRLEFDWRPS